MPLFPLPNIVFFPHTRMPLHIFEPRYRQMVHDALESNERFGIVLLRPGWEAEYFGAPAVYDCGTAGTIEQSLALDDGRYNIVVRGDVRFRILEEVSTAPYRIARVIAEPDPLLHPSEASEKREWLAEVSRQYMQYLPDQSAVPEIETVSLEALANALIMSLNLDMEEKQRLLELDDLLARAQRVGTELASRMDSLRFLAPFRRAGDPGQN